MKKINKLDKNELDAPDTESENDDHTQTPTKKPINLEEEPQTPELFHFEENGKIIHIGSSKICVNELMKMAFEFLCIDFQKNKSPSPSYAQ